MFIAILKDTATGATVCNLYTDYDEYHRATFNPLIETTKILNLGLHGATYAERKNALHDLAVDYSLLLPDAGGLSYGELAIISDFFETNGKRYGLLKELHENAII